MSDVVVELAPLTPVPNIALSPTGESPTMSFGPLPLPTITLTPQAEAPSVTLAGQPVAMAVPLVTLAPITLTPAITVFDQAGKALDPSTDAVQLTLQAFMRGPAGFTPDLTILVHALSANVAPTVVRSGTEIAPVYDIGIPSLPGSFIDEFVASNDGSQTRTYGIDLSSSTTVFINGLRQASSSFAVDGAVLLLPDTLNIRVGDQVAVTY